MTGTLRVKIYYFLKTGDKFKDNYKYNYKQLTWKNVQNYSIPRENEKT